MNEVSKGREVIDTIDRVQLLITSAGQESNSATWEPKRTGYAALIQPFISVFNSSGVLIPTLQARHKYGLKIKKVNSETSIIPDTVDFALLNTYFSTEVAKPIAISKDDKLELKASHEASIGTGTFSSITMEVMLIVTYITEEEYVSLSRKQN
jgi:hypothetical protein